MNEKEWRTSNETDETRKISDCTSELEESNWYVLFVQTGKEEFMATRCRELISPELLSGAFVFRVQKMFQTHSVWTVKESVLFPGYVFLETDDITGVRNELRRIPYFKSLLGRDEDQIHSISLAEQTRLLQFLNKDHVVETSSGYKEGDHIEITAGPLVGHLAEIKRINRHKRTAIVETELAGKKVKMELGLELGNRTKSSMK